MGQEPCIRPSRRTTRKREYRPKVSIRYAHRLREYPMEVGNRLCSGGPLTYRHFCYRLQVGLGPCVGIGTERLERQPPGQWCTDLANIATDGGQFQVWPPPASFRQQAQGKVCNDFFRPESGRGGQPLANLTHQCEPRTSLLSSIVVALLDRLRERVLELP